MSFKNILKGLVDGVEGALGAIFIDEDGEEIDHYTNGDSDDTKLLGAHCSIHLREIERINRVLSSGKLNSAILLFNHYVLLISPVQEGYSILLHLKTEGNIGKGIIKMRDAVKRIAEEL